MNISCIICSELFIPGSDIYFTKCGHVFHYHCLTHWLERSKSCPQCRGKANESTMYKVFFNVCSTDANLDATTLLYKLENVNFALTLKEKEIKNMKEGKHKLKEQNRGLKEEIAKLENNERNMESTMHAFKEQINYFKTKSKEADKLSAEIIKLKTRIKDMGNLETVLCGTRDQVNNILKEEHNAESLALLTATLKKALVDSERKVRDTDFNLKKVKNKLSKYKKEQCLLESQNADLRRELQQIKGKYEKEKSILTQRLNSIKNNSNKNNIIVANPDAGLERRSFNDEYLSHQRTENSNMEEDTSLTNTTLSVAERMEAIAKSDSPYLPVKTNFGTFLGTQFQAPSGLSKSFYPPSSNEYSIFKTSQNPVVDMNKGRSDDVAYDGLGGSSKNHIFPSPRKKQIAMKRPKSSSYTSSNKFKKLSPASNSVKVTEYFRSSQ